MHDPKEQFEADVVKYTDPKTGERSLSRFDPICDFCCGDPKEFPIRWSYPAGLVPLVLQPAGAEMSNDAWGACDECHALIEAGEYEKLADRCLEIQMQRFPVPALKAAQPKQREEILASVKRDMLIQFEKFQAKRKGEAIPEDEFDPMTGERREEP